MNANPILWRIEFRLSHILKDHLRRSIDSLRKEIFGQVEDLLSLVPIPF